MCNCENDISYFERHPALSSSTSSRESALLIPRAQRLVIQVRVRTFELIVVQGHPRSSTLMPIESAYATSY